MSMPNKLRRKIAGAWGPLVQPVYVDKADGGPHVCPLFAFRNGPIATPHGVTEVHSRGGPDFKGIAPPNILRTRGSGPDQFRTDSLLNRVAYRGYMFEEIECGMRQNFGAFRPQTF